MQPHILEFNEPTTVAICRCWRSKDHPYCDGTHGRLVKPKERGPRLQPKPATYEDSKG
jgi:CDGSH-type Zn-finger protein